MKLSIYLWIVLKFISSNRWRSLMPVLGIIAGIASVMTIYSIAEGGKAIIRNDLSVLAEGRMEIVLDSREKNISKRDYINMDDIEILQNMPQLKYVYIPKFNMNLEGKTSKIALSGLTKKAILARKLNMLWGKEPQYLRENEILINRILSINEFGTENPVGETLELNVGDKQLKFVVAGIFEENKLKKNAEGIISHKEFYDKIRKYPVERLILSLAENEGIEETSQMVLSVLERNHGGKNIYTMLESSDRSLRIDRIRKTLDKSLATIGAVALILGGIGISNLMFVVVKERTPHIGIMRAVGAGKKLILSLFLLQSILLTSLGGLSGLIFGYMGGNLLGNFIGISPIFLPDQIIATAIVSILMGVLFGIVPAKKAADLNPVQALNV